MTQPLDFQSIIMALQNYWADQDCLIWQPYYSQVGAGTMNPATFLRVLGPEPWNVAYVEPSVRPDDGRYGDNPNRLQQHYQMQVILKPDPGNPQELYLKSLEAIGIDPRQHDIRFIEDNWQSPALGAWGLGWEVWLDGLEITQFTYFQQAGGMPLDPVSVEITYGLDRIAAPLQGVHGFQNIRWNSLRTFGDVNMLAEQEHSKYYFEVADVTRMHKLYDLYEAETDAALKQGLLLPAYDYLLKCSHTFNILDTRGAIGVTERQSFFRRMRGFAARAADIYIEQRTRDEFPWLDEKSGSVKSATGVKPKKPAKPKPLTKAAPFLLEIGTEELPQRDLDDALSFLNEQAPAFLESLHLTHDKVNIHGTPRRLVIHIEDLSPSQPDREEFVKGPPASHAFDSAGEPTKAAGGFAKGKGVSVKDLQIQEIDGGEYVVVSAKVKGRPSTEVLTQNLPDFIAKIRFTHAMRWNHPKLAFSRPIRWLFAMHGDQVVPFEYAGLQSRNTTRGLRFSEPESFEVKDPADYFAKIEAQGIILDVAKRREDIRKQVAKLAAKAGGEVADDPALLAEVTHLVEAPTALLAKFDQAHLKLPPDVLVSVMKKHQRYFPVEKNGALLPNFITVRNGGKENLDIIAKGNQEVLRARFADAAFFVEEDIKLPLEKYLPKLENLTFQKDLGSMLEKSKRIEALVNDLVPLVSLSKAEVKTAQRAAKLSKADLVTKMVVEMTSLQGSMGRYYASKSGETKAVGQAIFEHYLPRFSGDDTSKSKPGFVIGLADRLDSLSGLFAAGLAPTGNKDPFAQRRAALGLVQNLIAWDLEFDLQATLAMAAARLPLKAAAESQAECLTFIIKRVRNLLLENGYRYDVVDSVLAAQGHNPAGAARAAAQLNEWIAREDWETILPAYSRCVRITRDISNQFEVETKDFSAAAEKELLKALEKAEKAKRSAGSVDDLLNAFTPMIPAIDQFFEDVLVMDEDKKVRQNRLGLLQRIAALADGVADLSHLEGF